MNCKKHPTSGQADLWSLKVCPPFFFVSSTLIVFLPFFLIIEGFDYFSRYDLQWFQWVCHTEELNRWRPQRKMFAGVGCIFFPPLYTKMAFLSWWHTMLLYYTGFRHQNVYYILKNAFQLKDSCFDLCQVDWKQHQWYKHRDPPLLVLKHGPTIESNVLILDVLVDTDLCKDVGTAVSDFLLLGPISFAWNLVLISRSRLD